MQEAVPGEEVSANYVIVDLMLINRTVHQKVATG